MLRPARRASALRVRGAQRAFREGWVVEEHPHPLHAIKVILWVIAHRLCSSELIPTRPLRKGRQSARLQRRRPSRIFCCRSGAGNLLCAAGCGSIILCHVHVCGRFSVRRSLVVVCSHIVWSIGSVVAVGRLDGRRRAAHGVGARAAARTTDNSLANRNIYSVTARGAGVQDDYTTILLPKASRLAVARRSVNSGAC